MNKRRKEVEELWDKLWGSKKVKNSELDYLRDLVANKGIRPILTWTQGKALMNAKSDIELENIESEILSKAIIQYNIFNNK